MPLHYGTAARKHSSLRVTLMELSPFTTPTMGTPSGWLLKSRRLLREERWTQLRIRQGMLDSCYGDTCPIRTPATRQFALYRQPASSAPHTTRACAEEDRPAS